MRSTTRQVADEALYRGGTSVVGPGIGANGIVWRPGGVEEGNVYTTFPDAFTAAALVDFVTTIYIDDSIAPANIPPGLYDGKGMLLLAQYGVNATTVTIKDGATLRDVGISSLQTPNVLFVICECVTTQAFEVSQFAEIILYGGIVLTMQVGALVPALLIGATDNNSLIATASPIIDNSNAPGVPVIQLVAGANFSFEVYTQFFPLFTTGTEVAGPVGSTINFFHDDSTVDFSSPVFFGTVTDHKSSVITNASSGSATAGQVANADGAGGVVWAPVGTAPALGAGGVSAAPIVANVTTSSKFFFSLNTPGGTPGFVYATSIVLGSPGSFKISSTSALDTSIYNYEVLG